MSSPRINLPSTMNPVGWGVTSPESIGSASPLLADNIDPVTNDYVSLTVGIHPVDARVINNLKIVRGSGAAVVNVGNRIHEIRKIEQGTEDEIKSIFRQALDILIDDGDIEYLGATVGTYEADQQVEVTVEWINLRALDGLVKTTTVRLPTGG